MKEIKNIFRIRIICLLITVLGIANLCKAQDNTGCFTKFQLMKMQKTSLDDMRNFLNTEGWSFDGAKSNQSFNYFDYSFNYNIVQWEKSSYNNGGNLILYNSSGKPNIVIYQAASTCFQQLLNIISSNSKGSTKVEENILSTSFKEGGLTIEFREYKNDYSSRQYSILIYNSAALQQEIKVERDKEEALIKSHKENEIKYQNTVIEANRLFNLNRYEEAKLQYEFANQLKYDNDITNKIDACNDAICNKLISAADIQFESGNYESSITFYQKAIACDKNVGLIQNKITLAKNKIKEIKVNEKLKFGDSYFSQNNFALALEAYNAALIIDVQNNLAIEGIKKVNFLKELLSKRKTTVFSYQQINPTDFSSFKDKLQTNLNNKTTTDKNGSINFEFKIAFDTLGFNKSTFTLNSLSDTKYSDFLNQISKSNSLLPSKVSGYFIASKESINIDFKWQKDRINIKSNSKGINSISGSVIDESIFTKYINSQNYKYGKFTFEVTNKTINNSTYNDIKLVNYKTSAGPASVFYSIIMPGMGTLKVTNGQKGWVRFATFLISSGVAMGSKLYSDEQQKKYLSATDQAIIDKYYNNANTSHKIALVSGGLSASIYLYDIIWVFSKGIKNIKESKSIRKQLHQGPVIIQNQPITLQ